MKVNLIRDYTYKNGNIKVYDNGHTRIEVSNLIRWFYSTATNNKDIKAKQLISKLGR